MKLVRARALLLGWRIGHVVRRARQRVSARAIRLIERRSALHGLPRKIVARFESVLIRAAGGAAFDPQGYLEANPDVRAHGCDALGHYLSHGWREGRRGGAAEQLMARIVCPGAPVSPLAAALASGTVRPDAGAARVSAPDLPTLDHLLNRLAQLEAVAEDAEIDVIVPVYAGRIETLNTILRVLEAPNRTPFRLVLVDDCGPDPSLRADVARLGARGLCDLVRQPRNLGFVAAINIGMRLHPDRDAIWLNADTEVWGDWIDRLLRVADADPRIATVTPLTNNGTIASYPVFDRDNPMPLEISWAAIDRLASEANGDRCVDAPTCVGFCVLVRRAAWDDTGPLDERTFGRGYGEENDFSCRAAARNWRNVIAGGVFVRHLGACSFGDEKSGRIGPAMEAMARLHPSYPEAVRAFAAADPVEPLRHKLDLARLARSAGTSSTLIITHARGGGTARHVAEEIARLRAEGRGAIVLSGGRDAGTGALTVPGLAAVPSLSALPLDPATLGPLLRRLGVDAIAVHHTIEFGEEGPEFVAALAGAMELPVDLTLHDYFSICPRINLADNSGRYCGEPGDAGCRRCLAARRSEVGAPDIEAWRSKHGALLGQARSVVVPDNDVAHRINRYFPGLRLRVVPHECVVIPAARPVPAVRTLPRIAVIGAIGPIKGFDVLLGLAREARRGARKANFTVIGYTRNDKAAEATGIHVTGPYREADIARHIRAVDPDLIFIPSTWPETFCYTLSHAIRSGRPVAAFALGAQGRRLAEHLPSGVLPLNLIDNPELLLERLIALAAGRSVAIQGRALSESTAPP